MRIPIKYYDNWAAAPMIICVCGGCFFLGLGTHTNSDACYAIGWILLALFVVFKIINVVIK